MSVAVIVDVDVSVLEYIVPWPTEVFTIANLPELLGSCVLTVINAFAIVAQLGKVMPMLLEGTLTFAITIV